MESEDYISAFWQHVFVGGDPYQCWQEDGFWPERVDAELEDLLVWSCHVALSYCSSGDIIQYLTFISGRTLPEMRKGFDVLDCPESAALCQRLISPFGDTFPRNDKLRADFVESNLDQFRDLDELLWEAQRIDRFELKSNEYCREYCEQRGLLP